MVDRADAYPRIGVLECFYGRLWPEQDRHRLLRLAATAGAGIYVYGPAGDDRTGSDWRRPWTDEERRTTRALGAAARAEGVELVWRVSPMAPLAPDTGIRFDSEDDLRLLRDRLREAQDAGASRALVGFDDVSRSPHSPDLARFANSDYPLASAQAHVAGLLQELLGANGMAVTVCPTEYWGMAASTYRAVLHRELPADIAVCWTGPGIVSGTITDADVAAIGDVFPGRDLWLWDNFPVNDWGTQAIPSPEAAETRHLLAGALTGRAATIRSRFRAHLVNASTSPALTALALAALASANEGGPGDVGSALERIADPSETEEIRAVIGPFTASPMSVGSTSAAERAAWQALLSLDDPRRPNSAAAALDALRSALTTLQRALAALSHGRDDGFGRWLLASEPHWFGSLATAADAAATAADALIARLDHRREAEAEASSRLLALAPGVQRQIAENYPWAFAIVLRAFRLGSAESPDFPPKG